MLEEASQYLTFLLQRTIRSSDAPPEIWLLNPHEFVVLHQQPFGLEASGVQPVAAQPHVFDTDSTAILHAASEVIGILLVDAHAFVEIALIVTSLEHVELPHVHFAISNRRYVQVLVLIHACRVQVLLATFSQKHLPVSGSTMKPTALNPLHVPDNAVFLSLQAIPHCSIRSASVVPGLSPPAAPGMRGHVVEDLPSYMRISFPFVHSPLNTSKNFRQLPSVTPINVTNVTIKNERVEVIGFEVLGSFFVG